MNWKCAIPDLDAVRIAAEIDRDGYSTIRDYVPLEELRAAYMLAVDAVAASSGEYVCFTGPGAVAGTVLAELSESAAFRDLCRRVYELGTGHSAPETDFYQVFRCLQGHTGVGHSYRFHYDSYVLTALLPVAMPLVGRRGDLLLLPNTRRIRRFYLSNVLDKALLDNPVAQSILRRTARVGAPRLVAIRLQPGHIYFFWGYRSIHTNEPCDPDKLRATALFHFGDPHEGSRVRALLRPARQGQQWELAKSSRPSAARSFG